jgi:hypothetical protein
MSRRVERHNERSDRDLHASDKKRPAPDSQMQTGKTKKSKSDQILDSLYDDVKKNPEVLHL